MYVIVKLGCSPNYDGFKANFKSAAFRLTSLLIIQGSFKQFAIEYKMAMRLILFFTVWDKGYLVNCLFYKFHGLREEKMEKFIAYGKYSHQNTL